jgi:Ca2+-binding RTX toxin-like protein
MIFNGADVNERVDISANGNRVRIFRDAGNITMDFDGIEEIDFNARGGADTLTVFDLLATDVAVVNVNLESAVGGGDGQADSVIINGTEVDDVFQIAAIGSPSRIVVGGQFPFVNIAGAEDANDRLTVNTLGGNDAVDAGSQPANLIGLTLNGGAGNDILIGGGGNDLVNGGTGNDMVFLEAGDDTFFWNPGDGSDTVEGMAGRDAMIFNGADVNENITISANGGRLRFVRDIGNLTMDLNGVERIDFNARGGADAIAVSDLSGTDIAEINVNLTAVLGGTVGDAQVDSVTVNGSNGAEFIPVLGTAGGILVNGDFLNPHGLPYFMLIRGVEAADSLRINGNGGDDTIDAASLDTRVTLTADGGDDDDTLTGSLGDDVLLGGAGNDTLHGGPGLDVLDGGPGDNVIVQD